LLTPKKSRQQNRASESVEARHAPIDFRGIFYQDFVSLPKLLSLGFGVAGNVDGLNLFFCLDASSASKDDQCEHA
jgi:hypothetical protein